MRTKTLKVNGTYYNGILLAGIDGCKIYAIGTDRLVVQKRNRIIEIVHENDKMIVMKFVNANYCSDKEGVVERMREYLESVTC